MDPKRSLDLAPTILTLGNHERSGLVEQLVSR